MKTSTLLVGAAAAVGLTVLGLAFRGLGGPAAASSEAGNALFPGLMDRVNDVVAVEVQSGETSYAVRKDGDVWGLSAKGGYPVDRGQVAQLILGIAQLETIEAKTADPTRHDKLGVQDPTAEGATSKRIELREAAGGTIAALVVGDVRSTSGMPSVYVRKVGEDQSWLVKGRVDVQTDPLALLDKKVLELARDEVEAAETVHPDGEAVLVSKDDREDTTFHVRDVPEGQELRFESVGNGMGQALEYLNLTDVLPAAEFEAPEGDPVRTSYWTWDDLRIDVAVYEKDEQVYATFRARYDEDGAPGARIVGPTPPEEEPGEAAAGEDAPEEEQPARLTPDEVRTRAQELNERLEPWVFEIATYAKNNFTKRMTDMVKEPEPEPQAGDGGALDGLGSGALDGPPSLEDLLEPPPDDATGDGDAVETVEPAVDGDAAAGDGQQPPAQEASGDAGTQPAPQTPPDSGTPPDPETPPDPGTPPVPDSGGGGGGR